MKRFILLLLFVAGFMIVASGNCLACTGQNALDKGSQRLPIKYDEVTVSLNTSPNAVVEPLFTKIDEVIQLSSKDMLLVTPDGRTYRCQPEFERYGDEFRPKLPDNVRSIDDLIDFLTDYNLSTEQARKVINANIVDKIKDNATFFKGPKFKNLANKDGFIDDIITKKGLLDDILSKDLLDTWEMLNKYGVSDIFRRNVKKLEEIKDLIKKNNLGWGKVDFENFLNNPWDNVDEAINGVKKASDLNIPGLAVKYKKFPQPKDGSYSYVLDHAKKFQSNLGYDEAGKIVYGSGDANLSFELNKVSLDNIGIDNKIVDRKFGHSSSIFDKIEDNFDIIYNVKNKKRAQSLIDQAGRQINAVGGDASKIRWEISTKDGANGIRELFKSETALNQVSGINKIEIVFIKP